MKPDHLRRNRAFEEGKLARCATPLHSGEYKLHEAYRNFVGWRDEIARIGAYKHRKAHRHSLRHCTPDDCAKWLKDLPKAIAYELAHKVLPGIKALASDGVSQSLIESALAHANPKVNQLVVDCDRARGIVASRIASEYERMKVGDSYIYPLADDAVCILDAAFQQTGLPRP